jgi:cbb3-type cytochrome oxidase subunit 3
MKKLSVFFFLGFLYAIIISGLNAQEKPQMPADGGTSSAEGTGLSTTEIKPKSDQLPKEKEEVKTVIIEEAKKEIIKQPEPVKEIKKNKPDEVKKAERKNQVIEEPKKAEKKNPPNDDKISEQGLLYINDDFVKYSRIPGIKIKKPAASDRDNIIKVSDTAIINPSAADSNQPKGLFGLSKRATDVLAVSSIIFLIAVIFVLYRSRSGSPRRKTLRNYSKTIISSRKK